MKSFLSFRRLSSQICEKYRNEERYFFKEVKFCYFKKQREKQNFTTNRFLKFAVVFINKENNLIVNFHVIAIF